jgi:hypothetical protein
MSGMFTGYDGTDIQSIATPNWENSVGIGQSNIESGQDSFTAASELYDFAVKNKALVQVTIYTSDGTFIPKKSTSTTFRDSNSNISFKGYIKEFEQVYIRQDRNYYMLKFEIIDFGINKCKTVKKVNTLLNDAAVGIGVEKPFSFDFPQGNVNANLPIDTRSNNTLLNNNFILDKFSIKDVEKVEQAVATNKELTLDIFNPLYKTIYEAFNGSVNSIDNLKNLSNDAIKIQNERLINELNRLGVLSNKEKERLSILNEAAELQDIKNRKLIFDYINKSLNEIKTVVDFPINNIKTFGVNSFNNIVKEQLLKEQINTTITNLTSQGSFKQGLFALSKPLDSLTPKQQEINNLINLTDLNSLKFDKNADTGTATLLKTTLQDVKEKNSLLEAFRREKPVKPEFLPNNQPTVSDGVGTNKDEKILVTKDGFANVKFPPITRFPNPLAIPNTQIDQLLLPNNSKQQNDFINYIKESEGIVTKEDLNTYGIRTNDPTSKFTIVGTTTRGSKDGVFGLFRNNVGETLILRPSPKNINQFELVPLFKKTNVF